MQFGEATSRHAFQADNEQHQRAGARRADFKTDPTTGSVACDWYARHGHWFVGFKSPFRDRYLWEISIPNDSFKGTSTR